MKKILCFLIIVSFLGLDSCKKDADDPAFCGTSWATQVTTELNAVSNAAAAYASTPNATTCSAYKAAYQGYLDALEKFLDCSLWSSMQKTELENAIAEAEDDLDGLC
jgi:hypothetical protein